VAIFPTISKLIKHNQFLEAKGELKKGFGIPGFQLSISSIGEELNSPKRLFGDLFEKGSFPREGTPKAPPNFRGMSGALNPFGVYTLKNKNPPFLGGG